MKAALTATCPAAGGRGRVIAATLDWAERGLIVSLYGWLVARSHRGDRPGQLGQPDAAALGGVGAAVHLDPPEHRRRSPRHPVHWALALAGPARRCSAPGGDGSRVAGGRSLRDLPGNGGADPCQIDPGAEHGVCPGQPGTEKSSGPTQCLRHPWMQADFGDHNSLPFLMNPNLWNVALHSVRSNAGCPESWPRSCSPGIPCT